MSANSLLQATITGGKQKRLQLKLLSAERGCLVASGTTLWNPKKDSVSSGEAAATRPCSRRPMLRPRPRLSA